MFENESLSFEEQTIIQAAERYVQQELANEASGHDWWHIYRVTQLAKTIAEKEQANLFLCILTALLHDIGDEKFNESEEAGLLKVQQWLEANNVSTEQTNHILSIIANMSFKGGNTGKTVTTLEGKVVQDADRLDAIGAIGIARVMAYSGNKGRLFHDPHKQPREQLTQEEYRNGEDTAIMHFYEKLLKLKEQMNTNYGRLLAEKRHQFMELYLEEFYQEWDGHR